MEKRALIGFSTLFILTNAITACTNKKTEQLPNIILCMADDQGWGDMGYYGHPVIKTPNLDEMASTGLRFDRFYASSPVCSPTRGSVMTGRHPNRFGCYSWGFKLRPQEVTIAEALKTAGYVTGHFGKWHLGSVQTGSPVNPGASGFEEWFSAPNFFDNDPVMSHEGKAVKTYGESSIVTIDAALRFIRKHAGGGKPVFSVIWFGSPHLPYKAAREDSILYAGQAPDFANYYGEITGIDGAMGKLRKELKGLGIADNTLVWYCSDNGGHRGCSVTGGRACKGEIYEGGLRVPAIIEWPAKINKPRITKVPANTFDIYPTLLEIVGTTIENQPCLDGISLNPIINNQSDKREKPIGFWKYTDVGNGVPGSRWMDDLLQVQKEGKTILDSSMLDLNAGEITNIHPADSFPGHAAWIDWPYKLHRIQKSPDNIKIELYNLEQDSMEQINLAETRDTKIKTMLRQLEDWQKSVIKSLNGEDY